MTISYQAGKTTALVKLGLLGQWFASPIAEALGKSALNNGLNDQPLYAAISQQAAAEGLPIRVENMPGGPAYVFDPKGHYISMPPNMHNAADVSALAHELGHGLLEKKKYLRHLQGTFARSHLPSWGQVGSFITGATHDKDRSGLTDAALVTLPQLPLIAGEGYATYRGQKALQSAGATLNQLRKARNSNLKALGSYVALGLGGAGANYGLGRLLATD